MKLKLNYINSILFLALTLILHVYAYAINAPQYVYRFDTRTPEEIFTNGFTSWGHNYDIVNHIAPPDSGIMDSGFISTTELPFTLHTGGERDFWDEVIQINFLDAIERIYVYTIVPDTNFWNMNATLQTLITAEENKEVKEKLEQVFARSNHQQEWFAQDYIPANRIIAVQEIDIGEDVNNDPTVQVGPIQQNPYINNTPQPAANTAPYPTHEIVDQENLSIVVTIGGNPIFLSNNCANSTSSLLKKSINNLSNNPYCNIKYFNNYLITVNNIFPIMRISYTDNIFEFDNNSLAGLVKIVPTPVNIIPYYIIAK